MGAAAVDDHGGVLGDHDASRRAQNLEADIAQQQANVWVDYLSTGHYGKVIEERLAAIAEERRFDGDRFERLADGIDHQGGQCLALDILGDDQQRLAGLGDLLQQRQ